MIIQTADLCDAHEDKLAVVAPMFASYGGRPSFGGPIATLKIEDLMRTLAKDYTIVVVTHNMQQAARVSDWTAFLLAGEERTGRLIEYSPTEQLFTTPRDKRTEDYITGRFG